MRQKMYCFFCHGAGAEPAQTAANLRWQETQNEHMQAGLPIACLKHTEEQQDHFKKRGQPYPKELLTYLKGRI